MPIYKTDKKKDGKQQYRVVVNYTDTNGEYKQLARRVYGKTEAKDAEAALERKVQDKEFSRRITIRQLYEEYTAAKIHEVRTSSLNKTKSILSNHILNTDLADRRLDRLTIPILQEWKNNLGQKDIMISTKNNAIRELNALLNYAVRMEYLPKNPHKKRVLKLFGGDGVRSIHSLGVYFVLGAPIHRHTPDLRSP